MSDDEELLFGLLGTQFNTDADEQTEFKRSKLKRKAADEEVVDAKGYATRFHGAFTGGFSAGYYNTVGSKEGFQPSGFVSQGKSTSRNYRITKPEDFMDDEDFDQNGIAPKLLRTKSIFDNDDIRSHMKQSLGTHDIVGDCDLLKDILVPQGVTIGFILLRKLGYLASRGVGENSNFNLSENDDTEISSSKKFDYESEETFQLIPKNDKFGLGYSGMNQDLIFAKATSENQRVNFGHKEKKGIRGVAFSGVDVEDDNEDIRDIYGIDSISNYNYEYIENDKEEKETMFGWTAPKNFKNAILPSDQIPGFQIGTKITKTSKIHYEPLEPPRFYLPIFPIRKEKENIESKKYTERPKLMSNDDIGSVLNLLSSDDRNRLLSISKNNKSKTRGSRWGDSKISAVEEKFDIIANLTSIRNESNNDCIRSNAVEIPLKFEQKQNVQKSWGIVSSLSSKFKSAGRSTAVEDNDYYTNAETKVKNDLELSTKELAANNETYGFMTRSILEWHPDKLLCKRFNVPDPFPGNKFVGVPDDNNTPEMTERSFNEYHKKRSLEAPESVEETKAEHKTELLNEGEPESASSVEIKISVPDISDKPPIDLFKAVFDDSDAEFSSSEDESQTEKVVSEIVEVEEPISILSSMGQALGAMFGGDSQNLNNPPTSKMLPSLQESSRIFGPTPPPDFIYNPVLPSMVDYSINDIISKNIPRHNAALESESYVYIDKVKSKKNKHEKKSKKSKTQKKDKKKKQKKKKTSLDSESSD